VTIYLVLTPGEDYGMFSVVAAYKSHTKAAVHMQSINAILSRPDYFGNTADAEARAYVKPIKLED
jgi:hypothetical protein